MDKKIIEADADKTIDFYLKEVDRLNAHIQSLESQLEDKERWIDDLQSGMYINCVYCGHRYPPGTNAVKRKILYEHIKICPKHPLSKAEAKIKELESQLKVEWDEEWIREVENNLERYDIGWSDYPHIGVGEIRRFLSLLKKSQEEKMRLEDKLSKVLIEKQIFERSSLDGDNRIDELKRRMKKLVGWIEKHRLDIWGDGIVEHPADKELYKHIKKY